MRILFVGNNKTERCGVAEFGRHAVAALRKLGHEVRDWDWKTDFGPSYTHDAHHGQYDVVFVNWHAGTLGWQEFDVGARGCRRHGGVVSAYLHESSPAWNMPEHRPPLLDQVDVAFVDHPKVAGASYFRTPVWDVQPVKDNVAGHVCIGTSGIRREGVAAVSIACQKWCWLENHSHGEWLSDQDEVTRLAGSWINVAHYGAGFGGQASAMGALIAAGQPILINSNRMLETWQQFSKMLANVEQLPGGFQLASGIEAQLYLDDDLEHGLLTILADIRDGVARRPTWLKEAFSWPRQAERMVQEWGRRLK